MSTYNLRLVQHDDATVARLPIANLLDDTIVTTIADELTRYVMDCRPAKLVVDFTSVDVFRDRLASGLLALRGPYLATVAN